MRTSLSNNIALNLPASALDQPLPYDGLSEPLQLSPRLHNKIGRASCRERVF